MTIVPLPIKPLPRLALAGAASILAAALLAGPLAGGADADEYDRMVAPVRVCPGSNNWAASTVRQLSAMRCLHNYARAHAPGRKRAKLKARASLYTSARLKAFDVLSCQQLVHEACGKNAFVYFNTVGYGVGCSGRGENLGVGEAQYGSARSIMRAWLHSPGHRQVLLGRRYRDIGIGLVEGSFEGHPNAQVWVAHFGYRC
jgi:uncharacterized protein YkwD